jgi:hypothetical protein
MFSGDKMDWIKLIVWTLFWGGVGFSFAFVWAY